MRNFRQNIFNTESIVVRINNFGESDRLINIITPKNGLIRGIAKGAKKPKSRIGGHLDLLKFIKLSVKINKNLATFNQTETLNSFNGFRNNLSRMSRGIYMGEIAEKLSVEGAENIGLFDLLVKSLHFLEKTNNFELITRWYELNSLKVSGFSPELNMCVETGKEIQPGNHLFSTDKGGIVDINAKPSDGTSLIPASMNTIKLLRHLNKFEWKDPYKVLVDNQTLYNSKRILREYIHFIIGNPIKSEYFMDEIFHKEKI